MARVLIMGAGGVGGLFGAELQRSGHDVGFVARGANLQALQSTGLRVTGARGDFVLPAVAASGDPASLGERDLVLLCVKSYDLEQAAEAVRPCGGTVITLQNGVDAGDRARAVLGDTVLSGCTNVVADLVEPGHIAVISPYARIRFGELRGGRSERAVRAESWLREGTRIDAEALEDVRIGLWEKMANICAMGGLTTLYRCPIGKILADPRGRDTFRRIIRETEAVARASGVPLPGDYVEQRMAWADGIPDEATSSMYRDLVRGRRLEIDHLNGAIVRLGRACGVPVPVNEAVYAGIRLTPR